MPRTYNSLAYIEVVFAALIFGSSGVFIKYLALPLPVITFFRLAVPTLALALFFLVRRHSPFHGNIRILLLASLLNALRMFLYFTGYTYSPISVAVILLYTWPLFVTILSALFLRETIPRRNIILIPFTLVGVVLIFWGKPFSLADMNAVGMLAMVGSALVYSTTVIIFKNESEKHTRLEIVFYQNALGALLFAPALAFFPLPETPLL